ncbi:hypothetical protein [Dictyobacter kobayashii]|uniref:hypothetical protein n=1 Tax=Dictyobacter kobayashii TaxID=2014872 RepID=UPI000F819EA1|nr:hypothetical protein [Dictyobacter kobayashii]
MGEGAHPGGRVGGGATVITLLVVKGPPEQLPQLVNTFVMTQPRGGSLLEQMLRGTGEIASWIAAKVAGDVQKISVPIRGNASRKSRSCFRIHALVAEVPLWWIGVCGVWSRLISDSIG